jgi:hypothetical protein
MSENSLVKAFIFYHGEHNGSSYLGRNRGNSKTTYRTGIRLGLRAV